MFFTLYGLFRERFGMIISSIKEALHKSWRRPEITLLYLVLNLSIALLSMVPYLNAFQTFFTGSLVTDILSRHNIYTYYAEFYHYLAKLKAYKRRLNTDIPNFTKKQILFEYYRIVFYKLTHFISKIYNKFVPTFPLWIRSG